MKTLHSTARAETALYNNQERGCKRRISAINRLAKALEVKDPYTHSHCESVARLAVKVAEHLKLKAAAVEAVRYAALLHDIGKIAIPNHILLKPGPLLPEEFAIIQTHSAIGSEILQRVPSLRHIAPIVLLHHERLDGSGYPYGLRGAEIPLPARIISAVDAFDAMTSQRLYSAPLSTEHAVIELKRNAESHFDPEVVSILSKIISTNREAHSVTSPFVVAFAS